MKEGSTPKSVRKMKTMTKLAPPAPQKKKKQNKKTVHYVSIKSDVKTPPHKAINCILRLHQIKLLLHYYGDVKPPNAGICHSAVFCYSAVFSFTHKLPTKKHLKIKMLCRDCNQKKKDQYKTTENIKLIDRLLRLTESNLPTCCPTQEAAPTKIAASPRRGPLEPRTKKSTSSHCPLSNRSKIHRADLT
jgi:hypothetical protein